MSNFETLGGPTGGFDESALHAHVAALLALGETHDPIISCTVATDGRHHAPLQRRKRALRSALSSTEGIAFDDAMAKIDGFLDSPSHNPPWVALFARGGARPFFTAVPLSSPAECRLSINAGPDLYDVMGLEQLHQRYVVMFVAEACCRLIAVRIGAFMQGGVAERPELRGRIEREWTRELYASRVAGCVDLFLRERLNLLERLLAAERGARLLVVGEAPLLRRVCEKLPLRLASQLAFPSSMASQSVVKSAAIVADAVCSVIDREERHFTDPSGLLLHQLRRDSLAVTGTFETLDAVERNELDLLVVSRNYRPPPAWLCQGCLTAMPGVSAPVACARCGQRQPAPLPIDLKAHLSAKATMLRCRVKTVVPNEALEALGGIGGLLRCVAVESPRRVALP